MRADKLRERKKQKALEAIAALGIDTSTYTIAPAKDLDDHPENRARQGEAALAFLAKPSRFVTKKCLFCEEYFGTDYNSVGYCSNHCRDRHFKQQTNITVNWGAKTDVERWGGGPPLIIDPKTLKHLAQYHHQLKSQIESQSPSPEEVELQVVSHTEPPTEIQTIPLGSPAGSFLHGLEDLESLFVVE